MLEQLILFIVVVGIALCVYLLYKKYERTLGGMAGGMRTIHGTSDLRPAWSGAGEEFEGTKCTLSDEDIAHIKEILGAERLRPEHGGTQTDRQHVEHCMHQLIRFAHLAKEGHEFRGTQFGLNLGRAQEILGSYGGVECWWRLYEPLIKAKDYDGIITVTKQWLKILDMPEPTAEFISRV